MFPRLFSPVRAATAPGSGEGAWREAVEAEAAGGEGERDVEVAALAVPSEDGALGAAGVRAGAFDDGADGEAAEERVRGGEETRRFLRVGRGVEEGGQRSRVRRSG